MLSFHYKKYGNILNPQKMLIFLHGYKSSMEDISPEAALLSSLSPQTLVITPQSPKVHKNNQMRYWYNVSEYDTMHKRRNPQTSVEEIVQIYNSAGEQLGEEAKKINHFIDEAQQLYNISDDNTYIAGFSQGAMLALYTALSRKNAVGGCFVLSGIVAGKDNLEKDILSNPKVYWFHGKLDDVVQYKTVDFSVDWLKQHNIDFELKLYDNLGHKIDNQELEFIAQMIK